MSAPGPHHLNPTVILGSASPRRAALLQQLGIPFEQIVSPTEELTWADEPPQQHVVESARRKAESVAELLRARAPGSETAEGGVDTVVIGADTVVCLGDRVLGKPADAADAAAMLRSLSGRTHWVYTGVALIRLGGHQASDSVGASVTMRPLSEHDIDGYVATGEPLDKAGAYGIQGRGARFIERVEGCYYTVVGLPLARVSAMLEEAGLDFGAL